MSRLFEKWRPRVLADVVGQPQVAFLRALAARPYPCCLLLHGPPGCGKTCAAYALGNELGCEDDMSGLMERDSCDLTIDNVRDMVAELALYPMCNPRGLWKVLVIEELEGLNAKVDGKLKTALEKHLPAHAIVVATSNSPHKISHALRQRFKPYEFQAGPEFAVAAQRRMEWIWRQETGGRFPLPADARLWGWDGGVYSFRVALDQLQDHLTVLEPLLGRVA